MMPTTSDYYREQYIARINRVMDYIETHLADVITLEELAEVATFSKFHFHRLFTAMVGESLYEYIRRKRLERAGSLLIEQPGKTVAEIGYECGFSAQSVFTRAFKSYFGMNPTRFRKGGFEKYRKNRKQGSKESQTLRNTSQFEMDDSPDITDEDKLRSSVCITIPEDMAVKGEIGKMKVAGGKYAMCRFEITTDQFPEAWKEAMSDWLPSSGYICDDRLPFELYLNNAQEHPQKMHILDICIPVRPM